MNQGICNFVSQSCTCTPSFTGRYCEVPIEVPTVGPTDQPGEMWLAMHVDTFDSQELCMLRTIPILCAALCNDNYTFEGTNWTVYWSVTGSNITFDMFGPADGWIGIGFSETPGLDSVSFPFN